MYILYLLFFILGAVVGSFINMAVYRVKHEQSFSGRSYCDFSKKQLEWQDLIPILSFVIYGGKCRRCRNKLSAIYPLIEFFTGFIFLITVFFVEHNTIDFGFNFFLNIFFVLFFVSFLIFFAAYDYFYWEVNVRSAYIAIAGGIIINLISIFNPIILFDGYQGIIAGVFAAALIGLIVLITKGGGMGAGDIYLFGFAGLFVGIPGIYLSFWLTIVLGALIGLIKAAYIKKLKGVLIQFAPFISMGALITFFLQDLIIKLLHFDSLKLLLP